ncbi:hypothetical protein GCM10010244_84990 [Streptomyces coeruleorubidus]|nr:hypothetical protein GCM10010244_84990 [Streptomyces bellus]
MDEALAWAGRLRYGATSLLLPTSDPDAWNVFDYLPDHTTSPVTEQAWQAALDHATEPDRITIGVHAYNSAPPSPKPPGAPSPSTPWPRSTSASCSPRRDGTKKPKRCTAGPQTPATPMPPTTSASS